MIDDKGGILVMLNGLKQFLKENPKPKLSLRVFSSPKEEISTWDGFGDKITEFAKDSWLVLGFEPALDDGGLIEGRRGVRWYHLKVEGKEAHAGRGHREGINACLELARMIKKISKFTNHDKEISVSVGRMHGGQDKFNIVCGSAEAKVDTRFSTVKDGEDLHRKIEAILKSPKVLSEKTGELARVSHEVVDYAPAYQADDKAYPLLEML